MLKNKMVIVMAMMILYISWKNVMVKCSNHYRPVATESEHGGGGWHGVARREMGETAEAGAHFAHHASPLHFLQYSTNNKHSKRRVVIAACSFAILYHWYTAGHGSSFKRVKLFPHVGARAPLFTFFRHHVSSFNRIEFYNILLINIMEKQ